MIWPKARKFVLLPMSNDWALILGASSGFGAATSLALAQAGFNIAGVHMDRRETLPAAEAVKIGILALGREALFFNGNAADALQRQAVMEALEGKNVRILFHSLAFGSLKPMTGPNAATPRQIEMTADVMGHSLIYWARDLVDAGSMREGGRIVAMTSEGSVRAIPQYGPVSAAKAVLEAHIRQLAVELAPFKITANALLAGTTDTPALRKIPGHEKLLDWALARNPHHRLTTPEDIAQVVVTFASPATAWVTGNTIRVDGGEGIAG